MAGWRPRAEPLRYEAATCISPYAASVTASLHVLVDTTATWGDLRLKKSNWVRLLHLARAQLIRLYVSEVTVRETVRHFHKQTSASSRDVSKGLGALKDLDVDVAAALSADVSARASAAAAEYEQYLRARLLEHGVTVLPVPEISQVEMLERDLRIAKPFADSGKGFRDTLIWLSFKELILTLDPAEDVLIVGNNVKDFFEPGGATLARPLLEELGPAGVDRAIRTAESIKLALHQIGDLKAVSASDEARALEAERIEEEVRPSLHDLVSDALEGYTTQMYGNEVAHYRDEFSTGLAFYEVPLPTDFQNPTIYSIEPDMSTLVVDVYDSYEGGTLAVHASVTADVSIDGYMFKGDYYADEGDAYALDADWNDHMAWVAVDRTVRLSFSLTVTPDAESVDDLEFESAEPA